MTIAVGWLASAGAVLLLVPLPELGLPLLLVGLRLLALEHAWAARGYAPVSRAWARIRPLGTVAKLGVTGVALGVVAALVWWLA